MKKHAVVVTAVSAVLLTACGGGGTPSAPASTIASGSSSTTASAAPAPSSASASAPESDAIDPSASAAPKPVVPVVGSTVTLPNIATFKLFEAKRAKVGGDIVNKFLVRGCNNLTVPMGDDSELSIYAFKALGPDGEIYEAESYWVYGNQLGALYPDDDDSVAPGKCVKGWIIFGTSAKVVTLEYQNDTVGEFAFKIAKGGEGYILGN